MNLIQTAVLIPEPGHDSKSEPGSPDISRFDRALHAAEAKLTGGLSPAALGIAWLDWTIHLANQPGRRSRLARKAAAGYTALAKQAMGLPVEQIAPQPDDHRFRHPGWQRMPYVLAAQQFLRAEQWWQDAATGIPGLSRPHERIVSFLARQILDIASPSNIAALNPEVVEATQHNKGENLQRGLKALMEDMKASGKKTQHALPMLPGKDVALTPGRVVFRNELFELLQYAPTTATVHPEPILIVPAWIMKYYILDLSPHNSMVRYLAAQGFTVFCISWLNPGVAQRDTGLDDYRKIGVMAALDAVNAICGSARIHGVGYCLGGTLLTIAAAAMARDHDGRLASLTLLAAQTDFTEAGELQLFISEAQLAFLDDIMWEKGYLDSIQMAGAFQMLASNDLIWSRLIRRYYLGEQDHPNDMMSWNQDATRMPFRMHSEYLRHMFLNNDFAEGHLKANGRPVSIADIRVPVFVIGTETDHIAPWRSVYKVHLLNDGDITFVLTSGGHNAGVVSEPGHKHRHYRMLNRPAEGLYSAPEEWFEAAPLTEGSWWTAWVEWLAAHSAPAIEPPAMGNAEVGYPALEAAPGRYIMER